MRLRRLAPDEVDGAHALIVACGRALAALGHHNWDPPIPLAKMQGDARDGEVWLAEEEEPVATFTLSRTPTKPWPREIFDPSVPALYVNRLAVEPSRWRSGVGAACMREIESLARARGIAVVRLDVYRKNPSVRRFYERLGYVSRGDWDGGDVPLTCFEKELT